MKYLKQILLSFISINLLIFSALYAQEQGSKSKINYVNAETIIKKLPDKSINVGFDIDDTVLFSAPCFYKNTKDFIKTNNIKYQSDNALWKIIGTNQEYWNKIALCDAYSIPKSHTIELLRMHQNRGDRIYFITARVAPEPKYESFLNMYLADIIGSAVGLHSVIYATNKTSDIKSHKLDLFYGDSDSDYIDAKNAGTKFIRILRSKNNPYAASYNVGSFNEQVLQNSDY